MSRRYRVAADYAEEENAPAGYRRSKPRKHNKMRQTIKESRVGPKGPDEDYMQWETDPAASVLL